MESPFDFIIVGAGASGAVLASRVAHTPAAPSILLVEAGPTNEDAAHLDGAERFNVAFAPGSPMNWHYKTTPQIHLTGQEIDYSRGRGLGGSTAINFCGWTVGPKDDYDEWADIVGDNIFGWKNVKRVLNRIENLDTRIPDSRMHARIHAERDEHSTDGNLNLSYGEAWQPDIDVIYSAAEQSGHRIKPDVNDGDPIGVGMGSVCIAKGIRETSMSAYLSRPPPNLKILPNTPIAKVMFEGRRAIGVQTVDGRRLLARKEVILSGGALNTPQTLMLSGMGPADELKKHNIPLLHELPMVGRNLQDHCFSAAGIVLKKDATLPPGPPSQSPTPMGWLKLSSVTSSAEFKNIPTRIQRHMERATVPAMEIATHAPTAFLSYEPTPSEVVFGAICLIMNPQSKGSVTLCSSNPSDSPIIDPKFLMHPFDRRVLIEGMRETMRILSAPVYASRTTKTLGPQAFASASDEDIWEHIKSNLRSSWHMSCTAIMGRSSEQAVVDSKFKVFGVQGLRVVDMSVCPFVINAHIQSTAYIVGEIAAEVLAEEYNLGQVAISGKPGRTHRGRL